MTDKPWKSGLKSCIFKCVEKIVLKLDIRKAKVAYSHTFVLFVLLFVDFMNCFFFVFIIFRFNPSFCLHFVRLGCNQKVAECDPTSPYQFSVQLLISTSGLKSDKETWTIILFIFHYYVLLCLFFHSVSSKLHAIPQFLVGFHWRLILYLKM